MKALAWDDEKDYLVLLGTHLKDYGIRVELTDSEDQFIRKFREERWDFVITDLLDAREGDSPEVGVRIAKGVQRLNVPVFLITKAFDRVDLSRMNLPNVIAKSKSTHPGWMAGEIYEELVKRGVYVDRRKVFLIYGRDRDADGARGKLEQLLASRGIEVMRVAGRPLDVEIAQGLLNQMNSCSAFLAICTPDDKLDDGRHQPRQNVLLEIGMAMGLSRGVQRLLLIQRWGPRPENQALIPSDLGGVVTVRFQGEIENQFSAIEARLVELGVELRSD